LIARSENISDGEEGILPVLSNRILVTEATQLPVRGTGTKNFRIGKLLNSAESETLNSHSLTVEYTSNPAWFAIQALPILAESPHESADETFNRYYANVIAGIIAETSPAIKAVFEKWKSDTAALNSKIEKNAALKQVLLAETPWVLDARSETAKMQQLALMFDAGTMRIKRQNALMAVLQLQGPSGGFSWFPGGTDDRYITQYILAGIGHLSRLNPATVNDKGLQSMIEKALAYLDESIKTDYDRLAKNLKTGTTPLGGLDNIQIQYLYVRSFFSNYSLPASSLKAYSYFRGQAQKNWVKQSRYGQAMIALALQRTDDLKTSTAIIASLKENAIINEEMGMYWKDVRAGYYWHQAPVETQAVLIEAFAEIAKDDKAVTDMKTWLIKQKQTQSWSTSRATAEACYALFLSGKAGSTVSTGVKKSGSGQSVISNAAGIDELLNSNTTIDIKLGPVSVSSSSEKSEPGTGYFSKRFTEDQVRPSMGNVQVTVSAPKAPARSLPGWGAVYWQYFENLDQVTANNGAMQIKKQIFIETQTANGPVLKPIQTGITLKVGDKVKIRLELKTDRDLDYVHLKDMRAASMEPVNVLSGYKWQDGLSYYESTGDASTNFYFGRINKGTYVFEYPVFITHTGSFNNGIATFQSFYAPEFSAHSEGRIITVE